MKSKFLSAVIGFFSREKVGPDAHENRPTNDITELQDKRSARVRTTMGQNLVIAIIIGSLIGIAIVEPLGLLKGVIYFSIFYYILDFLFYIRVIVRGLTVKQAREIDQDIDQNDWPSYTVLCPMYKEQAVLPQFIKSMNRLDYPKDKLQVLLLLEEDDQETIDVAEGMELPEYFEIVVVPHSMPKTKPKACNYGLTKATGEYCVIYDAEDDPEPDQLKIAITATTQTDEKIGCVQAKLNFYNRDFNFMTKLFTLEYSLWYEVVLPGLMAIKAPIPLGGTSNHFNTALLRKIGAWDAHNVTEDADLGMRLAQLGYRTLIIDSTTYEEPNGNVRSWIKQRSRWIKGYMQTHLVHSRNSRAFLKNGRLLDVIYMHILLGIRSFGLLFTVLMISIFLINSAVSLLGFGGLELAGWASYLLVGNLILINAMYIYTYALGMAKRGQWDLITALVTLPFYWFIMLIAACKALYELIVKPYYWQKTEHGLHLHEAEAQT